MGQNLNSYLLKQNKDTENAQSFQLELKELCAQYTTDVIASVAYGVEANSFKDPNSDFRRSGREIFSFNIKRGLQYMLIFFCPQLVPLWGFKVVPPKPAKFLCSTLQYVMKQRKLSGQRRNDLIDILIELTNLPKTGNLQISNEMILAQGVVFFTGGFESSSSTMAFTLYELAKNQEIQQKLRNEIKSALICSKGLVTFEMIESLQYMQMVIDEVLRMYPSIAFLDRECTIDSNEQYSLKPFANINIKNGTPLYIPIAGLHKDPKVIICRTHI